MEAEFVRVFLNLTAMNKKQTERNSPFLRRRQSLYGQSYRRLCFELHYILYFHCYIVHVVELLNYYTNHCTYIKFIKFTH